MDQLKKAAQLRSNSVHAFKRFADLVKLTVVQLPAKGREGKLDEGTLHRSKSQKAHQKPGAEEQLGVKGTEP